MKKLHVLILAVTAAILAVSCAGSSDSMGSPLDYGVSTTTGWEYNSPDYAGIEIFPYAGQPTAPGLTFIEGGTFSMGRNVDDLMGGWNNVPRRVTVSSFYMDQYEVTNAAWKEYMHWLKLVFKEESEILEDAHPDELVWARALAYNDKHITNYLYHPAYNDYPVVGVSWEQAKEYCLWRSDRINEDLLVSMEIIEPVDYTSIRSMEETEEILGMVYTTRKYLLASGYEPPRGEGALTDAFDIEKKVDISDGILFPEYRLPTEAEWEYAAYGMLLPSISLDEGYGDKRFTPWDGDDFRDLMMGGQGQMMANFSRGRGDYMGVAGNLNDGGDYTVPVWAYMPNDFGLYCMAGNVNEWVFDVFRPSSSELVQSHNAFRGNQFMKPLMVDTVDEDGEEITTVKLDEFGRVMYEDYAPDSIFADRYRRSDLRNFKDGDPTSSYSDTDWSMEMEVDAATKKLYEPDGAAGEGMLSIALTNTVRVYKGGSFNDRAYYLNPSQRRYLEQAKSKDDLGFRCAMDRIGASTEYGPY